jgi:prepilin-type N-terminal cleavage/methylation domain-containing protein
MQKRFYAAGAGFTMVEILVVLMILGIVAGVMIPMMGNTDAMKLRATGQQIVSALAYAQNSAIAGQDPIQVVFNTTAGSYGYSLEDEAGVVLVGDVSALDFKYALNFSTSDGYSRVKVTSALFDENASVWFDRLGGPHGGDIADAEPALTSGVLKIAAGNSSMTITMAAVTGTVSIQ